MGTINMLWFLPDIFSIHGDRGNIWAFEKAAKHLRAHLNIVRFDNYDDEIDWENTDIIYVPPAETVTAEKCASIMAAEKQNMINYLERGGYMVVIGTSIAAFAKRTQRYDGSVFEGLGIVDVICKELRTAYSNDAIFVTDAFGGEMEVVGGQIQMLKLLFDSEEPLGKNIYGYGNNKGDYEGIKKGTFIHTNLLGPVFVKNPWFAEAILRNIAEKKGIDVNPDSGEYALEHKSNEEIKKFIQMKIDKYDQTRLDNEE